MGRFRTATLALFGGVAGCMAVGAAITGCGGDDTVTDGGAPDVVTDTGAPDTSSDGTTQHDVAVPDAHDAAPGTDGTIDAHETGVDAADARVDAADAGVDAADAGVDAGDANEAGHSDADAGRADADAGPTMDASDGGSDGDAGVIDSGSDVSTLPPGLVAYPAQYAAAACTGFAACCGPTFDVAGCEAHFTTVGYDNTLPSSSVYSNGHLAFNADAGAGCVAALRAWPCGTTITGTQNAAILSACHGVLSGTIPIGGTGCTSSFECVSGSYCQPGSPTGTCIALAGTGGACSPAGESPDQQCSYIGTAQPGLYCDVYPNDGGGDGGVQLGVCAPALPDGVGSLCTDQINFYSDYACINRGCDLANTGACAAAIANPAAPATQFECANYVLVDAGSD